MNIQSRRRGGVRPTIPIPSRSSDPSHQKRSSVQSLYSITLILHTLATLVVIFSSFGQPILYLLLAVLLLNCVNFWKSHSKDAKYINIRARDRMALYMTLGTLAIDVVALYLFLSLPISNMHLNVNPVYSRNSKQKEMYDLAHEVWTQDKQDKNEMPPLDTKDPSILEVNIQSRELIYKVLGKQFPASEHYDLKYRTHQEIYHTYKRVFTELPTTGFLSSFKNPCFESSIKSELQCLPYAYVLGQPKCGTSDLFERLKMHKDIVMPQRKEIRWFTRGEFTTNYMEKEPNFENNEVQEAPRTLDYRERNKHTRYRLSGNSSLHSFTNEFTNIITELASNPMDKVTIDGGPHTFWWGVQNSDGSFDSTDIPIPQILREIQPNSQFLITLADPVRRMYSDYYFLDDNLRPFSQNRKDRARRHKASDPPVEVHKKSAAEFHERALSAVNGMYQCINHRLSQSYSNRNGAQIEFNVDAIWDDITQATEQLWGLPPSEKGKLRGSFESTYVSPPPVKGYKQQRDEVPWFSFSFSFSGLSWFSASATTPNVADTSIVNAHAFLSPGEINSNSNDSSSPNMHFLQKWFRASQECAHDRFHFGKGGHGRLSIGLYSLFYEKWLEHFSPSQFLFLRLEEYDEDPVLYLQKIFNFLKISNPDANQQPSWWDAITSKKKVNENKTRKDVMQQDTEMLLRRFYQPFNNLMSHFTTSGRTSSDKGNGFTYRKMIYSQDQHHQDQALPPRPPVINKEDDVTKRKAQAIRDRMVKERENRHGHLHERPGDDDGDKEDDNNKNSHNGTSHGKELEFSITHLNPHTFDISHLPQHPSPLNDGNTENIVHFDSFLAYTKDRVIDQNLWKQQLASQQVQQTMRRSLMSSNDNKMYNNVASKVHDHHNPDTNTRKYYDDSASAEQLCVAAFGLDLSALHFLLYDMGIPASKLPYVHHYGYDIHTVYPTKPKHGKRKEEEEEEEEDDDDISEVHKRNSKSVGGELEFQLNPWYCMSQIYTMADAHSKSHVFSMLKGTDSWLTSYFNPPLPKKRHSILGKEIVDALQHRVIQTAQWLLAAEVMPKFVDIKGNSVLHEAVQGGMTELVRLLVSDSYIYDDGKEKEKRDILLDKSPLLSKKEVDGQNNEGRTALHYAVAYGHGEIAQLLVDMGKASMDIEDKNGVTARSIASSPGALNAAEALKYLKIAQRPPKHIRRHLQPGSVSNKNGKGGWRGGDGQWSLERLKGFEGDMQCDIDQYWEHEVTATFIYENYFAQMKPVLIRGLFDSWPAIHNYTVAGLSGGNDDGKKEKVYKNETIPLSSLSSSTTPQSYKDIRVQVSEIPYANKFGGAARKDMTLGEYVHEILGEAMPGGEHPWYVFRGHPIPHASEAKDSLVPYSMCPTPQVLQSAFEKLSVFGNKRQLVPPHTSLTDPKSRNLFINAQWALGGKGTGAPVHYHNTAWNALIYGAKKWILYSPHNAIMSNKQIKQYFESDLLDFIAKGHALVEPEDGMNGNGNENGNGMAAPVKPFTCVQTAGDTMIVPESWGHGVLNIQDSVAVATEAKGAMWRVTRNSLTSKIPKNFDNRDKSKKKRAS